MENNSTLEWQDITQEEGELRLAISKEVENERKENINPKKASGYDSITGEILK